MSLSMNGPDSSIASEILFRACCPIRLAVFVLLWLRRSLTGARPLAARGLGLASLVQLAEREAGSQASEGGRALASFAILQLSSMSRNCPSAVSRLSTISRARTTGSGRCRSSSGLHFSFSNISSNVRFCSFLGSASCLGG